MHTPHTFLVNIVFYHLQNGILKDRELLAFAPFPGAKEKEKNWGIKMDKI